MLAGRALVAGLCVLATAGCHGDSHKGQLRLSPGQYKDRVNRICADAANLTSTLAQPSLQATADEIGTYAQQLRQILAPHVRAIEEIPVPPSLRPDMLQVNDLFKGLLARLNDQIDAGRRNDGPAILAAADRIESLQGQLSAKANAIGLTSCASS